jgi:phosphatidylserine/phosphatidylglycerophosphate/cardiolipin synthase-like enzyme
MLSNDLVSTLAAAQKRLPVETWKSLSQGVRMEAGAIAKGGIGRVVATVANPEVKWELKERLSSATGSAWAEVAAAILAIDMVKAADPLQVIWSGPASRRFAARRIDQVLYDLLASAKRRAWIVTFSAHRIERFCRELLAAHQRRVQITLLLETEEGSAGQLTHDAQQAFQGLPLHEIEILHWPRDAREKNAAGRPGKLHAKCAVIDDTIVIGSANFTDDAFNRNMELGVVAKDPDASEAIVQHFRELEMRGVIHRLAAKGTPGRTQIEKSGFGQE